MGDVDEKAKKLLIQVGKPFPSDTELSNSLLVDVPVQKRPALSDFITRLYTVFADMQFTYLEINPLVVMDPVDRNNPAQIFFLDLAAKLDQTAEFECGKKWSVARKEGYPATTSMPSWGPAMVFPAPFGREMTKEEAYIADLDSKTGASLKLTILNPTGRVVCLIYTHVDNEVDYGCWRWSLCCLRRCNCSLRICS